VAGTEGTPLAPGLAASPEPPVSPAAISLGVVEPSGCRSIAPAPALFWGIGAGPRVSRAMSSGLALASSGSIPIALKGEAAEGNPPSSSASVCRLLDIRIHLEITVSQGSGRVSRPGLTTKSARAGRWRESRCVQNVFS
jgi:hypothetical protein